MLGASTLHSRSLETRSSKLEARSSKLEARSSKLEARNLASPNSKRKKARNCLRAFLFGSLYWT
ncbi:hypothetical protein C0W54_21940 [Photobacterium kishitanii]|nr:hypothetical protein C0W54_21940 [Photobacterium kishitanii]